jgi:hypothetical protein
MIDTAVLDVKNNVTTVTSYDIIWKIDNLVLCWHLSSTGTSTRVKTLLKSSGDCRPGLTVCMHIQMGKYILAE